MRILVTGVAGFIGMHVALRLLADGHEVIGLDSVNNYYDVRLKQARLAHIGSPNQFNFHKIDLADRDDITSLFAGTRPEIVINLAAQAGVRYSLENPHSYMDSNLVGFTNILEACRHFEVGHLVYASSSSVYGLNEEMPFHEGQNTDHPLALYGATKKANELMAHSYSHLFNMPTTGLRFFTVYGPWGRPDMALFKFTECLMNGKPIDIYNKGDMMRDFTYIDDVVDAIVKVIFKPASNNKSFSNLLPDPATSSATWRVFNVGRGQPVPLMDFVSALEIVTGKKAELRLLDMQPGDVKKTYSDTNQLQNWVDWVPFISIAEGVEKFFFWYQKYYKKNN